MQNSQPGADVSEAAAPVAALDESVKETETVAPAETAAEAVEAPAATEEAAAVKFDEAVSYRMRCGLR